MKTYIVQSSDIGKTGMLPVKSTCECCGNVSMSYPFEPLGKVIASDVGKMLKLVKGVWYAENTEQFKKRIGQA